MEIMKSYHYICMSVDDFSDVKYKSLLNVMAGGSLSFVFKTFRLEGKKKSASNMGKEVSNVIKETSGLIETPRKILGFFTDSPPVMHLSRRLLWGLKYGGSSCILFAYGMDVYAMHSVI